MSTSRPSPPPLRVPRRRAPPRDSTADARTPADRRRFLAWDDYRVEREWRRYEGTPLRDLYRQLRERFLARHRPSKPGRSLELGPGPGRFTGLIGHTEDRITLLELSRAMLERVRADVRPSHALGLNLVQGDAVTPPFRPGQFHRVALLGNVLGFAGRDASTLLSRSSGLVSPGGRLLVEFVAGPGERSRYLHRLPAGAIARLLVAPVRAVLPRVEREGFDGVRERASDGRNFRRFDLAEIEHDLHGAGFEVKEAIAVAPLLGNDQSKLGPIRTNSTAWDHLVDLEEIVGREPRRLDRAAAVLVAAERRGA